MVEGIVIYINTWFRWRDFMGEIIKSKINDEKMKCSTKASNLIKVCPKCSTKLEGVKDGFSSFNSVRNWYRCSKCRVYHYSEVNGDDDIVTGRKILPFSEPKFKDWINKQSIWDGSAMLM